MRFCQTLERPTGVGKVYWDGLYLAEVFYSLKVVQEYFSSGRRDFVGLQDTYGEVTVIEGEQELALGSALTLRLSDGREWQFLALGNKKKPGMFKVLGAEVGESLQRIRAQEPVFAFSVAG
jgi:hypothetical protein